MCGYCCGDVPVGERGEAHKVCGEVCSSNSTKALRLRAENADLRAKVEAAEAARQEAEPLAAAVRYYVERRTMNNPKGWRHVIRKVEQAYPDVSGDVMNLLAALADAEEEAEKARAAKAEAEVQRLRDGITALADANDAAFRPHPNSATYTGIGSTALRALLAPQVQDKPEADCQVCHFFGADACKVHRKPEAGEPS